LDIYCQIAFCGGNLSGPAISEWNREELQMRRIGGEDFQTGK